jgi:hypothetical protein
LGPAAAGATSREPPLTVKRSELRSAVVCHGNIGAHSRPPIIYAPGTGSDGSQVWALGHGAFEALGRPMCTVSFPDRTTADVQVSVQYLVYAIRTTARRARQPVAVTGISQGGLLARMALTYWPSLRRHVSDVISVSGTQHGVATANGRAACAQSGCPPAVWQQLAGSHFLRALNDGRDETPGPTAWTTVRSATDTTVMPATGPHPTSALKGATNILIQKVCPGRQTTHIGTAVDSVTIAAITDAVTHRGAARVSRLGADVCAHPYGKGLDEQQTSLFLSLADQVIGRGLGNVPRVSREPRVRAWARSGQPGDRRATRQPARARSAAASPYPLGETSVTPAPDSAIQVIPKTGVPVSFTVPAPAQLLFATVEFSSQSVIGPDGTLADESRVAFGLLFAHGSGGLTYSGTSKWLNNAPGTYYFQFSGTKVAGLSVTCPGGESTCLYASQIYRVRIPEPKRPSTRWIRPRRRSAPLSARHARSIVRRAIRRETGRKPHDLVSRCSRKTRTRFVCKSSWSDPRYVWDMSVTVKRRGKRYLYSARGHRASRSCLDRASMRRCATQVRWPPRRLGRVSR